MIANEPWLAHLEAHLDVARAGRDPEGVHQVRVAAGRLGVWLRLGGWSVLRDDLRWLRRHAAAVRDLDVLLASGPPEAWAPWLRGRRSEARRSLRAALDAPRLAALRRALRLLAPLEDAAARRGIAGLARGALRAAATLEEHPADLERVHALRRALRRLRYGLDWVGEETREVKRLTDAFGDLNDLAVARRLLDGYRLRARLADYATALEARTAESRDRALGAWLQARERVAGWARGAPAAVPPRAAGT